MDYNLQQTIYGLKSKTIYISNQETDLKTYFQKNYNLGLPSGSMVVGIMTRGHEKQKIGANNKPLVNGTVYRNSYITVKDHANPSGGRIIPLLSQYYMSDINEKAVFWEPRPAECIDWNNSYIEIAERAEADISPNEVYEIIVMYYDDCNTKIKNRFNLRNGDTKAGVRKSYFEINLQADLEEYPLSNNPSIELPKDAFVIGFNLSNNENPLTGQNGIDGDALDSTYLTLKDGTRIFIEDFPCQIEDYVEKLFSNSDYFLIPPTPVGDIDWQQSKINVKRADLLDNTMVFQYYLIYYTPTPNS